MSAIVKTSALVLSSRKYRESSKLLKLYTEEFGKLSVVVKGIRRATSRFPKSVDTLSKISVIVYDKEGRSIQTVSQCDIIETYSGTINDLEKLSVALQMIELTDCVTPEREQNKNLFSLLVYSLSELDSASANYENVLCYFQIGLVKSLGYPVSLNRCVQCGNPVNPISGSFVFWVEKGGPVCNHCASPSNQKVVVSGELLNTMLMFSQRSPAKKIPLVNLNETIRQETMQILWLYLKYHVPGVRKLKTREVFETLIH